MRRKCRNVSQRKSVKKGDSLSVKVKMKTKRSNAKWQHRNIPEGQVLQGVPSVTVFQHCLVSVF